MFEFLCQAMQRLDVLESQLMSRKRLTVGKYPDLIADMLMRN
jgi:hypothetical protein